MPKFIIETTAEAVIREFWQIEAATAEDARDSFHDGEGYQLLWDETIGDEQNREVAHVHADSDLDGVTALHRAQQAAPAMLAALRMALTALERSATERGVRHLEAVAVRDAIALATGTSTGEAAGASPADENAPRTYTAFCQQANGRGTIWIDKVEGNTLDTAIQAAREACAFDWGCDWTSVHCLGLIEGDATVTHWEDLHA